MSESDTITTVEAIRDHIGCESVHRRSYLSRAELQALVDTLDVDVREYPTTAELRQAISDAVLDGPAGYRNGFTDEQLETILQALRS